MEQEAVWDFGEYFVKCEGRILSYYSSNIINRYLCCNLFCYKGKAICRRVFRKLSYHKFGMINKSVMLQTNTSSYHYKEKAKYHVKYFNVLPEIK